ncbi:MAG TPA: GtrA family protein [Vicinamibacterales bacterium]|nr:GtrA family protein [Vicinamibacterales bacterium]
MNRFVRFAIAGTGGFVVQIAALAGLVALGINYVAATIVAVEVAIVANFISHDNWTWGDRAAERRRPDTALARLLRFNALTGITSILGSVVLTAVFVEAFALNVIVANVMGTVMLSVVNFVGADRLVFRAGAVAVALGVASTAHASIEATLQPKTARDFARYAAAVEARTAQSLANNEPFLGIDRLPAAERQRIMTMLRRGEVIVERAAPAVDASKRAIAIDGGTINHWRGTVFVPKVTLDQLLKVLKAPQADQHKQEDVLSSRVVSRGNDDAQKVYLRLKRTKFVTVVYDTEYDVDYQRLAADRAASRSISTKVVEIENAGTPRERALPEGNDHGYMWRLNSYWRYQQVDGGVLVEVESLTLSRDLPAIVGPLISPIITSTAKESMTRTLTSVRSRFAH